MCSHPCPAMDTNEESVCCMDEHIKNDFFCLEGLINGHGCITEHPSFQAVILTQDNLKLMFALLKRCQRNAAKKRAMKIQGNKSWRYLANKQFVQWVRDSRIMGKHHCPIPACVVQEIRNVWPDVGGTFVPYRGNNDDNDE